MNLNVYATLDVGVDTQPSATVAMLSFQRLRVYQRSIEFLALACRAVAASEYSRRRRSPDERRPGSVLHSRSRLGDGGRRCPRHDARHEADDRPKTSKASLRSDEDDLIRST